MFKRSFVAALVLSLAAAVAFPSASAAEPEQEWGVPIVAVDWSSLRLWPGAASVRIIKSFDETITLGHDTYPHRSQILEYVIACADRTFALKDWVLTDGANGAGNTVWADRAERLDFESAPKGSLEAAVIVAACEVNPKSTVARNPGQANPMQ